MIKYAIFLAFTLLTIATVSAQSIPDNIIGYDPQGRPLTCGTVNTTAPPTAMTGELIALHYPRMLANGKPSPASSVTMV